MTVSEFLEKITFCAKEIGCNGKTINGHNLQSDISINCVNSDDIYELVDIQIERLSCSCACGIRLVVKKLEDSGF